MKIKTYYILIYIFIFQLIGYPLVASIGNTFSISSTALSIFNRGLISSFSLISLFVFGKKIKINGILLKVGLAFWFLYGFRLISYLTIDQSQIQKPPYFYLLWGFGACFLPFLSLSKNFISINLSKLFFIFLLISSFTAIMVLLNVKLIIMEEYLYSTGRFGMDNFNSISLGNFGNILLLPSYWGLINFKYIKKFYNLKFYVKPIMYLNILFGIIFLMLSASRGPIFGFLASFFILEITHIKVNSYSFLRKISLIGLTSTLVIYKFADTYNFTNFIERIYKLTSGGGRYEIYLESINNIVKNPFLGNAIETPITKTIPHNIILEGFSSGGIIIGLLICILVIFSLGLAIKLVKNNSLYGWIAILYIPLFIQSMVSGAMYLYVELWATIGALASIENCYLSTELNRKSKINNIT